VGGSTRSAAERLARAADVLAHESQAIARIAGELDASFSAAVDLLLRCEGEVVVCGIGKAGIVGQKVSATLASTGTPSFFLHPTEALHGDLGRIRARDLVLAFSNSGETLEVNALVPALRKIGAKLIAITGERRSTLARLADCALHIGDVEEACPLKLAPTASTTAMLALGDALALVVLEERGFGREDYALYHPAGALGRRLMRVREIMRQGNELPLVASGTPLSEVVHTISRTPGRPGAALVTDERGRLIGIFTDGDFRRVLEASDWSRLSAPVDEFMGKNPKTLRGEQLVAEAERLLKDHRIDMAPVIDDDLRPIGLVDVQDLLDVRI
jgi:arabinose-5-phosphate isomerase